MRGALRAARTDISRLFRNIYTPCAKFSFYDETRNSEDIKSINIAWLRIKGGRRHCNVSTYGEHTRCVPSSPPLPPLLYTLLIHVTRNEVTGNNGNFVTGRHFG